MLWTSIPIVLLGIASAANLFVLAMRLPARPRLAICIALTAGMWSLPLIVPGEFAWLRLVLLFPVVATTFKMYDLHAAARTIPRGDRPDPRDPRTAMAFLLAPPTLLTFQRWRTHAPVPHPPPLTATVPHLLAAAGAAAALVVAFRIDWRPYPFAIEYVTKVSLLFVLIPAVNNAMIVVDLRRGMPVRPMCDRIWLAPTPAEFWRRYNTSFHVFCRDHLFLTWGGRTHPALATLLVFLFSGVGHELLFTIALGRVEGYQLLFFTIQGIAVAPTRRYRPRPGWQRTLSHTLTIAFLLTSGTIFFASVQSALPFFTPR